MLRKIATSTLWQLSAQGVATILGLASVKLVTTGLSQELVGNYQTVYGFLQIFAIIADFGLYAVAVRELSRKEQRGETFPALFLLRGIITLLSLGLAVLLAFLLPVFRGTPLPLGIAIGVFVPFFILLSGMLRAAFQASYAMSYVFLSEVISKAIPVLLMAYLVFQGLHSSSDIQAYHLFLFTGAIGSFAFFGLSIALFQFVRGLPEVCPQFAQFVRPELFLEMKRLFLLSLPFGLAFFATTIYRQADLTLIALLRPDYALQNAYYGLISRISEAGYLLPTLLLNSALPALTIAGSSGGHDAPLLRKVLFLLLLMGFTLAIILFLFAKPIVLLLANPSYLSSPLQPGSDTALRFLSFSLFFGFLATFCSYLLLHKGGWQRLLIATTIAAGFSILLNLLLIPRMGFLGASLTSVFTQILLAVLLLPSLWHYGVLFLFCPRFARFANSLPSLPDPLKIE